MLAPAGMGARGVCTIGSPLTDNSEENRLFLDDAAGAGRARGSLETAGAALTQHTRPVLKS